MTTILGLIVAVCVLWLLVLLARLVYRAVRPSMGQLPAVAAAAGSVFIAYAVLGALVR